MQYYNCTKCNELQIQHNTTSQSLHKHKLLCNSVNAWTNFMNTSLFKSTRSTSDLKNYQTSLPSTDNNFKYQLQATVFRFMFIAQFFRQYTVLIVQGRYKSHLQ